MVDSSGSYRDKYLKALELQERTEKQSSFQLDLMRKTLTYLSSAAQGLDTQLDATLLTLREKMRGASGAQVVEQMERVQHAVTQFERTRDTENRMAAERVSSLIHEYLDLKIPKAVEENLVEFDKTLKKRLSNYRNYPAVLDELAKLQHHALVAAQNPEQGFWQRIRGGKTLKTDQESVTIASSKQHKEPEVFDEKPLSIDVVDLDLTDDDAIIRREFSQPSKYQGDLDGEDSYEQVAARIATTLANLVDRIEPNDLVKHKVDIVRSRIKRGMDWFALAVTLEDIRDILMLRYLQADEEFAAYLGRVNEELNSIRKTLGVAVDSGKEQSSAAVAFSHAVSSQVAHLKKTVSASSNITQLKTDVTECLSVIHTALADFDNSRRSSESITNELVALVNKVKSIESESQQTKKLLEEERRRATHDSLTELPNREAYNERAYAELQRFKRYGRPLTLAVCDIDYFKKINDTYGHQAGDKVLKLIASVVASRLRSVDFVGRYGGEEFVILMPETDIDVAFNVLDKIRSAIAKTPFRFKENPVQITLSFGLADFKENDTVEIVFQRADKALYGAKDAGRNKCLIAKDDECAD